MQRGRLREHWQLNCDIFGSDDYIADIEIIALAYQCLIDFGATPDMFEIQVNDRDMMTKLYLALGIEASAIPAITRLNDKREKIDAQAYRTELKKIVGDGLLVEEIIMMLDNSDEQTDIVPALAELGITNVVFNKSLARGFEYYTGTVFEFKDIAPDNNRSLLGGGRYDNLTAMFGEEVIPGVGFGFGDVTMRDFLETHNLLPATLAITPATITIIPFEAEQNLAAQKIAKEIRATSINVTVDIGIKKLGKKISEASERGSHYIIVVGEDESTSQTFTLKNLITKQETTGPLTAIIATLTEKA
jgi:histidyl-tRNA synthetase